MSLTLTDQFEPTLWPLLHFQSAFDLPDGIFSPFERLLWQQKSGAKLQEFIITPHPERNEDFYRRYFLKRHDLNTPIQIAKGACSSTLTPASLLENFPALLLKDLQYLSRDDYPRIDNPPCHIEGETGDLWLSPEAKVSAMASIDLTEGPVVIEKGASIGPFCLLKGPLYIGPGCQIDNAHISNSRIGQACRVGGEVSDSLMNDFSNKHHEGFLGHSLVGSWVNLGALTTTSDLKNNYGTIQLQYKQESYSTGVIKFGSIVGDFVKTGIGSMLNTGTIIDAGANLFEGRPFQKYYPPFFWGGASISHYEQERFFKDTTIIMKRRNQAPDELLSELIEKLHKKSYQ